MQTEIIDILIFISTVICVTSSLISAMIVYRRDPASKEHHFFALFFIGIAGFVIFYLFLQDPLLKEFSYILQLINASIAILGLFLFYYGITHKGSISIFKILSFAFVLFIPPIINAIMHPFYFIEESYGFELLIEPWYLLLISVIYMFFVLYTIIGLLWIYFQSENQVLKRKLRYVLTGLLIMGVSGITFFAIVPIFFEIHYLKPIGYVSLALSTLIMISAFKREKRQRTGKE